MLDWSTWRSLPQYNALNTLLNSQPISQRPVQSFVVKVRPHRLPRGVSCIIIGTTYHPPSANDRNMIAFLTKQLSLVESVYHNCSLILLRDFNNLNCRRLHNHFRLKRLLKFPTRDGRNLDLIPTNLDKFYQPPQKLLPFGLSDHFTIFTTPKLKDPERPKIDIFQVRDQHPRNKRLLALSLLNLTGQSLILFYHVMTNGLPLNRLFAQEWTFSFP